MLSRLHIQNYAIIDAVEIGFSPKLNIITGETGAGKSILMGALSLILGERADTNVLLHTDKKCFIEGFFQVAGNLPVQAFLQRHELDEHDELVLRREIAASGKSRAFINDTPATLQQLKEIASLLVDLHRQFDTLELGDSDFQRAVMDALAGTNEALAAYQQVFKQWQKAKKELDALQQQKQAFDKELDYHRFLYDELSELGFKANELEDLDNELKLLTNSEGIKTLLTRIYFELKESEQPVVTLLKQLVNQLQGYATYHNGLQGLIDRLQSAHIELQDIAAEAESINEEVGYDEKRIDAINERIAQGYKMLKKHSVQTTAELLQVQAALEEKLQAVLQIDDTIAAKEKEVKLAYDAALQQAQQISQLRRVQVSGLEERVNTLLAQVGMPNARLKVSITDTPLQLYGCDEIAFLFDANKSNRFEPIRKVASGGELSRLMLCIKSLVAQSMDLPTMIFDEIDIGISGEAARQVGIIMKGMAASRQIICITHQPQIAGKADAHYFVYKQIQDNDVVKTSIRTLNPDERITAIAKMLSGEKPSAAALESAREMMN